ncbi:RsmB/NOP family class I SAM-dependent RNA methyltransferase [Oerskovia enterophila]|uniref:Ribosomal RNA small subunit methyltransferase B n=1 Tax=Oerskovia enterophila TaxID=43678 RepID=A0A163T9N2_9CELL|nr:transcription antitermination factor NusB [Oerskovia enterophila]KZM37266.1 ribosomal RNA small subunit methyltransferase B [Oerskovia enterophila]
MSGEARTPGSPQRGGGTGPDRPGGDRRDAQGRERGAARARGAGQRSESAPSQRAKVTDPARNVAFDVLQEVASSDAYANLVLPPLLRVRGIRGRDAAFATELAYGTLRLRGRYDAIVSRCVDRPLDQVDPNVLDLLRLGAHQLLGMRVAQHAAVSETVGLARARAGAGSAQFVNAVLRKISRSTLEEWLEVISADAPDDVTRLAITQSHPVWIARAMREALVGTGRSADDLAELLEADNTAPRVTLVARPGLVSRERLAGEVTHDVRGDATTAPGRWAPTALVLSGSDPAAIPAVRHGAAGVQDEGSQLVTLAFAAVPTLPRVPELPTAGAGTGGTAGDLPDGAANPDERWLDLCAGPGGKAALLASLAGEQGARIVANEVAPHRARLVEQALAAVPADAVERVQVGDGRRVGVEEPGAYDRVLVDAPCTGLGALRRRPESRWRRTPGDIATLTTLQRELLGSALDAVRPGGVVGYVTCSPHLAETQLVVKDVLAGRDDVEVLDAAAAVRQVAGDDIPLADRTDVQLWPHVHGTDAMHLTLLRRRA